MVGYVWLWWNSGGGNVVMVEVVIRKTHLYAQ